MRFSRSPPCAPIYYYCLKFISFLGTAALPPTLQLLTDWWNAFIHGVLQCSSTGLQFWLISCCLANAVISQCRQKKKKNPYIRFPGGKSSLVNLHHRHQYLWTSQMHTKLSIFTKILASVDLALEHDSSKAWNCSLSHNKQCQIFITYKKEKKLPAPHANCCLSPDKQCQ